MKILIYIKRVAWKTQKPGLQLYQKETPTQVLFCEYCSVSIAKFLRTVFL